MQRYSQLVPGVRKVKMEPRRNSTVRYIMVTITHCHTAGGMLYIIRVWTAVVTCPFSADV